MNFSPFLSSLSRAIEINQWPIYVSGSTTSLFAAYFLGARPLIKTNQPLAVVVANEKIAQNLISDLSAFAPDLTPQFCPAFDESPYSGLYPSAYSVARRCAFLWRALSPQKSDIFIFTIESVLQKTLPITIFKSFIVELSKNESVLQNILIEQLIGSGYESAPIVEDVGSFSLRGDILDIYSPNYSHPIRIEFFGDTIESIRHFDVSSQGSLEQIERVTIIPCREILFSKENTPLFSENIKNYCDENGIKKQKRDQFLTPIKEGVFSRLIDFWLPAAYEKPASVISFFNTAPILFFLDDLSITQAADTFLANLKEDYKKQLKEGDVVCNYKDLYQSLELFKNDIKNAVYINDVNDAALKSIDVTSLNLSDFTTVVRASREAKKDFILTSTEKLNIWVNDQKKCFIFSGTQTQAQRLEHLFSSHGLVCKIISDEKDIYSESNAGVYLVPRSISSSQRLEDEAYVFLRDEDIFGTKTHKNIKKTSGTLSQRTTTLSFGDLNPNDYIVHTLHGIGIYEGLKKMLVHNSETEFIQLKYRDNDKLYIPIYRIAQIQKYSAPGGSATVDKLGTNVWQKTKIKVRSDLKEVAAELLSLYAKRKTQQGFSFSAPDDQFRQFEASFQFDETPDQLKAIEDVLQDMQRTQPMDRLICGDVGFGKTEVAIRAAFKAVLDKKQVAVLVPTTILAFQHHQTFTKRFSQEAVRVAMLSRFSTTTETKNILSQLSSGAIDIVIGTHKLLSKDVSFKNLGLLIIDEEQKFGVTHKEKIKKLKSSVDVLTLSATPIPRTLNMALMGIRDLSIINTPPEDRLSIRTFISRFNQDTIKKAVTNEVSRGGQVYFIHNKVGSINEFASNIKTLLPNVRIKIAHGQMPNEELEQTMLAFYNHEFDVLICTTIIESGLDIPRANTIIVDRADTFGLSQLYQLRGRVGRSKERAYAYLLIPESGNIDKIAAERLKILHEHTELGAGFQIAHHDLELRGSGNILGEDQSGHIAAVGYELYMELLDEALKQTKGEEVKEKIEPEINLRCAAFIPDTYIEDIRIRLGYYKLLTEINDESDLDTIEKELVDRFGQVPEQVSNLFGTMLIRKLCQDLGIKDISLGPKNLSLSFTNQTPVKPEEAIKLTMSENKKYSLTPDQKLIIRFSSSSLTSIMEELRNLKNNLT
ncbi:MAG: transcription-repair coupling factor [Oligoflexia bacterium]|nr:transcription-repair coupling factor [Oligoflexia bacterium]